MRVTHPAMIAARPLHFEAVSGAVSFGIISYDIIDWGGAVQDPTGQSVTVPSGTSNVVALWSFWGSSSSDISSITLNSASPDAGQSTAAPGGNATGVHVWNNPTTGSQTIDVAWNVAPSNPYASFILIYVGAGDTSTNPTDVDSGHATLSSSVSRTLTTNVGDLVIMWDHDANATAPSLPSGFTSLVTVDDAFSQGWSWRVSYIIAAGTSQGCVTQDPNYSTLACCAIAEG